MFKYVLSAFICLAFAMPAAAQCGCECEPAPAPACRTPKKLAFVPVKRCLPQITRKCVTDECGCTRRKFAIESVEVTGARLGLVDKDPCEGGLLKRFFGGLPKLGGGCGCDAAPEPCGCEMADPCAVEMAAEPCGCDGAVQLDAAPSYAEPMIYSDPVAAPAADCGCNG